MKKAILILLFAFALQNLNSQTVFAPSGATWYYSGEEQFTAGYGTRYTKYTALYDTTIQSKVCKKIVSTIYNYHQGAPGYNDTLYGENQFIFSTQDTVFYFNQLFNRFFPLYIFNTNQGDTLTFHKPVVDTDSLFRVRVDSISIFTIAGFNLKRVWTSPLDDYTISNSYIERIGGDYSLGLIAHEYLWGTPTVKGIRCYEDPDMSFNFEMMPCDYIITVGIEESSSNINFLIYPNPANENLNISISGNEFPEYYQLIDITGKILRTEKINSSHFNINTSTLPPAIYTLYVFNKNKPALSKRFSVTH
jgi:hypothetical protein